MQKSALLRALQSEIRRHDLTTFCDEKKSVAQGGNGVIVIGCPECKKRFQTTNQFIEHLVVDVLPSLLDRLAAKSASAEDEGRHLNIMFISYFFQLLPLVEWAMIQHSSFVSKGTIIVIALEGDHALVAADSRVTAYKMAFAGYNESQTANNTAPSRRLRGLPFLRDALASDLANCASLCPPWTGFPPP